MIDINRYPNYSHADIIAIDIETREHDFLVLGPSNYRKPKGHILGVAIAFGDHAEYYNVFDPNDKAYIRHALAIDIPKIGHNILYDVDWLESEGFTVNGRLIDTMIAEALIDNNKASYSLDSIAKEYLQETKEDTEIIRWLDENGIKPTKSKPAQDYLHLIPHDIVRSYALQDVGIVLNSWPTMSSYIKKLGLEKVFDLECELLRVLLYMRKTGVRYDTSVSKECSTQVNQILTQNNKILRDKYGSLNVNSGRDLAYLFDIFGIPYPQTDKGNPSITRDLLEHLVEEKELEHYTVHDYLPLLILNAKRLGKSERDYISGIRDKYICEDGETIRCTFHPTRDDSNFGTVSGRFSSSKPNLQQITSKERDSFIGGLCRRPFVPLPDHDWVKIDYSQIEYRFMAHYAKGQGSKEVRENYNLDPNADYHQYIQDLTGLPRPIAKNLNFGIAFGMGISKMRKLYGWSEYKAQEVLDTYHNGAPYVKHTMYDVARVAKQRGSIRTIYGRLAQLPDKNKAYVMFNRLIQGSAADLLKKAMVDIYKSGILDDVHLHLTVHDELDFSIPKGEEQDDTILALKYMMQDALTLRVPVVAEVSKGPNWGDVEKYGYI